jgi:hypothetical protein
MASNPTRIVRSLLLGSVPILLALSHSADAMCVAHPEIRSTVTILGCISMTLGATDFEISDFRKPARIYQHDATSSGTLMRVRVKTSAVSHDAFPPLPEEANSVWAVGEDRTVFAFEPANEICTSDKEELQIISQFPCCDMLPWQGGCMAASAGLTVVKIERGPEKQP